MDYLPIALDVRRKRCLVVGGGHVAQRKIDWLLAAHASTRVVAREACTEVRALHDRGALELTLRAFESADLDDVTLVIAATDDRALNARISREAQARGALVNVVDDPALCTFIVPALVDRSPVVVSISTQGSSPVLARLVRRRIETVLHPRLGALAAFAGKHRQRVRAAIDDASARRSFWEHTLDGATAQSVLDGDDAGADRALQASLEQTATRDSTTRTAALPLIALPAALDALTLGAMRALGAADVVLHDTAAAEALSHFARRDALMLDFGECEGDALVQCVSELASALATGARGCVICGRANVSGVTQALREARISVAEIAPAK